MKLDPTTILTSAIAGLVGIIIALIGTRGQWIVAKLQHKPEPPPVLTISRKPRVMIIDDEPKELELIRIALNGDAECSLHRNAHKAIGEIGMEYSHGRAFDLIILDCMMKPMVGERVVQVIQLMEMETNLRSPIVYFTRMGNVSKPARVLDVWRKPEDHWVLAQKVREIIDNQKPQ